MVGEPSTLLESQNRKHTIQWWDTILLHCTNTWHRNA
ncbi:Uncharacterised protein [Serratia marcescens]|nr:Uncharacterised protein [Serratia marcescens]